MAELARSLALARYALMAFRLQNQRNHFGHLMVFEVNQCHILEHLSIRIGVRVRLDFHQNQRELRLPGEANLHQPVGESPRRDDLRWLVLPLVETRIAREFEDRVAEVFDQPLAAAILVLMHGIPHPVRVSTSGNDTRFWRLLLRRFRSLIGVVPRSQIGVAVAQALA